MVGSRKTVTICVALASAWLLSAGCRSGAEPEIPSGSIARAVEQARQKGERTVTAHIRGRETGRQKRCRSPYALRLYSLMFVEAKPGYYYTTLPRPRFIIRCGRMVRTLSHYHIDAELGRGGMGVVYRASDTRLGRAVAIKMLTAEATTDADRIRRFVQEARSASALNHPNIVTIYDIEEADGSTFIAMELVEGTTLDRMLAGGQLPVAKALDLGTPDRVGARGRARRRHRPSRHQARQRHRHP